MLHVCWDRPWELLRNPHKPLSYSWVAARGRKRRGVPYRGKVVAIHFFFWGRFLLLWSCCREKQCSRRLVYHSCPTSLRFWTINNYIQPGVTKTHNITHVPTTNWENILGKWLRRRGRENRAASVGPNGGNWVIEYKFVLLLSELFVKNNYNMINKLALTKKFVFLLPLTNPNTHILYVRFGGLLWASWLSSWPC